MKNSQKGSFVPLLVIIAALVIGGAVYYFNTNPSTVPINSTNTNQTDNSPINPQVVFYTQSVANVRSCASTSCKSLGTYPVNTDLTLPYATISDLPEWIEFSLPDSNGVTQTGYINKINLGENKVTVPEKTNNQICEDSYGFNSVYSGQKNSKGGPVCDCKNGYEWNSNNTSCVLIKQQSVTSPNLQQPVITQQVGGMQGYGSGVLYSELITNSANWYAYDNSSMKILLSPYVCTNRTNILMMNNNDPVAFALKVADTGQKFFVTFNLGDCNNYLWGNN